MLQVLDTLVIILFVLFLLYIFRGYHLTRLDKERKEESRDLSSKPSGSDKGGDALSDSGDGSGD
jgi:hypothetical protein